MSIDKTGSGAELASAGRDDNWFSDFWANVFQDRELVTSYAAGLHNVSSQLYQQFAEACRTGDRNDVPVGERRRWHMLTLRENERDTSYVNAVRLGAGMTLGVQQEGTYAGGSVLRVGGHVKLSGFTAYPLDGRVNDIAVVADAITAPTHVLVRDVDFYLRDGAIVFRDASDPFVLGFPSRTVMREGVEGREAALWARDTVLTADMVYRFAGYAMGVRDDTSPWYLRYVNALWDLAQSGGTALALSRFVYTAANVPFAASDGEIVEYVGKRDDGSGVVITSAETYVFPHADTAVVAVGDSLSAGDPITSVVRIVGAEEAFDAGVTFVALPGTGLTASASSSAVTYAGSDSNGNPVLRFDLSGSQDNIAAFWAHVDAFCASTGVNQADMMAAYLYDYRPLVTGAVWGVISPARFFVDYDYANSAHFVLIERSRLDEYGARGIYMLPEATRYLPAGLKLVAVVLAGAEDEHTVADTVDVPADYVLCTVADSGISASESVLVALIPFCKGGDV